MKLLKMTFLAIYIFIFLMFAFQNGVPVDLKLFNFQIGQIPLFIVVIVVFFLGFILGQLTSWFSSTFKKK